MNYLKKIGLALCALAAVVCITSAKPAKAEAATKYYVTTRAVSMMNKASSTSGEVIALPKEAVMVVTSTTNSSWYKVEYQNSKQKKYTGYISTSAIKPATAYKTNKAAAIYRSKSSSSELIATVPKGGSLLVVNTDTSWYKVVCYASNGNVYRGYVNKGNLDKVTVGATYKARGDVYMRTRPTMNSSYLLVIKKGLKVTVTDTSNANWYKATYTNSKGRSFTGYIRSTWLVKV